MLASGKAQPFYAAGCAFHCTNSGDLTSAGSGRSEVHGSCHLSVHACSESICPSRYPGLIVNSTIGKRFCMLLLPLGAASQIYEMEKMPLSGHLASGQAGAGKSNHYL